MPTVKMTLSEALAKAKPFAAAEKARLAAIAAGNDSLIDFSDQEEITAEKIATGQYHIVSRGGRRVGAGRKPSGNLPVKLRLPPAVLRSLRAEARKQGTTLSVVATARLTGR